MPATYATSGCCQSGRRRDYRQGSAVRGPFRRRLWLRLGGGREDLAIHRNGDRGFDGAVRGQDHAVRIAAGDLLAVFDGQDVAVGASLGEFLDIDGDLRAIAGLGIYNPERIGLLPGNGDRPFDIGPRLADQPYIGGLEFGELQDRTADTQRDAIF